MNTTNRKKLPRPHLTSLEPGDAGLIKWLREQGVLEDVKPDVLEASAGTVGVYCPDCDRCHEITHFHRKIFGVNGNRKRHHNLALNGGALLLAPNSIIEDAAPSAVILIKNMATALHGKKLHDVCLYAHAPCLVATEAGMNILQTIKDVVEAKQAVREKLASTITNLRVHIFYHVDYGIVNRKRKMRTYRINKKRWEEVMSMLPPAS